MIDETLSSDAINVPSQRSSVSWAADQRSTGSSDDEVDDNTAIDYSLASTSGDDTGSCDGSLMDAVRDDDEGHINNDDDDREIIILCELVGARNLSLRDTEFTTFGLLDGDDTVIAADGKTRKRLLQPYCVVKFGNEIIHRTKRATEIGKDPIWTVSSQSLFLLKATPKDMSRAILNISLYDKRSTKVGVSTLSNAARRLLTTRGRNIDTSFLGQVNLDASMILSSCDGERIEFPIEDELGEETSTFTSQGSLALRFRVATESDQAMVHSFQQNLSTFNSVTGRNDGTKSNSITSSSSFYRDISNLITGSPPEAPSGTTSPSVSRRDIYRQEDIRPLAKLITETSETEIVQSSFVNAMNSVFAGNVKRDAETGTKKIRIKPGPDPDNVKETEFLSPAEITVETRQPSKHWVQAGSGTLGKLYLEILSCHDLPNVDVGEAVGNVTDSFVCAVFEDTLAMTDVIDDELCPHWLPWTQRAFCFGIMHPASILYLGVFDYDLGLGNHEPLGRVAVNVGNFRKNTLYTLQYNLYPSANVTDRTANGRITIRLRMECEDEKLALLTVLREPRPNIHINVKKEKSFKVVRYTCFGEYDGEEKFELAVTRSYVDEIFEYKSAISYAIGDTIRSLIFWRGQVQVCTIGGTPVLLPIYSLCFFCATSTLVERPYLIVPFTLLGWGMMMLATLTIRRQHPSPWNSCPSFFDYLCLLKNGVAPKDVRGNTIKEYEGWEAAQAYERQLNRRLEHDRKIALKRAALEEQISTIGDENISTKVSTQGAIPLELLNRLARYQGIIGRLCRKFRFIKIIVTWEESVLSFWITAGLLFAGLVTLLLPWAFILTWTGRIVTWGLFGPHMKIVDFTLRAQQARSDSDAGAGASGDSEDKPLKSLVEKFQEQFKLARMRREEAVKLKDIKSLAFGKYSIQVPSFNLARHYDRPLPQSCARVCRQVPKMVAGRRSSRRLSMADIPTLGPWIPGQQLYGTMIPRPEHEALLYKEEADREKARFLIFEKRVKEIMAGGGIIRGARLRLSKMGLLDLTMPSTVGYEVVPLLEQKSNDGMKTEEDKDNDDNDSVVVQRRLLPSQFLSKRLSIIPTDDDHPANDLDSPDQIVLESNRFSTYEITVCQRAESESKLEEDDGDEEGIEIVAMGRLSTLMDAAAYLHEINSSGEIANQTMQFNGGLSLMYQSSERTHVAFFRPHGRTSEMISTKHARPNEAELSRLNVEDLLSRTDVKQVNKGVSMAVTKRLSMFLHLIVFLPILWSGNVGPLVVAAASKVPSMHQESPPSINRKAEGTEKILYDPSDKAIQEILQNLLSLQHTKVFGRVSKASTLPFVTLTYAQSMDGCIGLASNDNRSGSSNFPISGLESKRMTHALRSIHGAILIGGNTLLTDNPRLTNRLWLKSATRALTATDDVFKQPRPVVLDTNLRHLEELIKRRGTGNCLAHNMIVYCSHDTYRKKNITKLTAEVGNGISIRPCRTCGPDSDGGDASLSRRLDLNHVLSDLKSEFDIQSVMVEGGAQVLSAFVKEKLVDVVCITIAPIWLGANGNSALQGVSSATISGGKAAIDLTETSPKWYFLGNDSVVVSKWRR